MRADIAPLSLPFGASLPALSAAPRSGPGSLLALPSGSIAGDLRAIELDEASRLVTYELLIANDTAAPLAAFTYAAGTSQNGMVSWSTITVPAFTAIAVTIDVPLPRSGAAQRVVVELHAEDAHLTLDAKPPERPRRIPRALLASAGAAAAALLGFLAYTLNVPRVLAVATPSTVVAGKPFAMAYVLTGSSAANYLVETPEGFQIRRGTLDPGQTVLELTLPTSRTTHGYDVHVTASGRLGTETRTTHLTAVPTPTEAPAPSRAASPGSGALPTLILADETVTGGTSVSLSYPTTGGGGTITLLDQNNAVRGTALLDRQGHASLLTPRVNAPQSFRVMARVQTGNTTIESTTGLLVKPAPAQPAPASTAASVSLGDDNAPVAFPSEPLRSGTTLRLPIRNNPGSLRIVFSTDSGAWLTHTDVSPGATEATVSVPSVKTSTEYLLVGTYRHGVGQETIIKRVTVHP